MNTSFGETLRAAREAKGLTTSQIAAKTRMLVQIVEEMENEDFHRIAAPIYGRGFVKLYAECVDLDPLPLVKEFMEIYEGRRAPIVRTREVPVAAPPAPEPPPVVTPPPAPEPIPEPPPVVTPPPAPEPIPEPPVIAPPPAPEPIPESPVVAPPPAPEPPPEPPPVVAPPPAPEPTPEPPPVVAPPPAPEPTPEPPPVVRGLELFEAATSYPSSADKPPQPAPSAEPVPTKKNVADIFSDSPYLAPDSSYGLEEGPSAADRFKKSLSSVSHGVIQKVRDIPRSVWRITLLVLATLVLLALLAWGCFKLYNATSITPAQQPQAIDLNASKDSKDLKDSKELQGPKDLKDTKDLKAPKDIKDSKGLKTAPKVTPKAAPKTTPKTTPKPAPAKPAKRPPLRSTGQKVPPLYAD